LSVDDVPWDDDTDGEPTWYSIDDEPRWDADEDVELPAGPGLSVRPGEGSAESSGTGPGGAPPAGPSGAPPPGLPRRGSGIFGLAAGAVSDATAFLAGAVTGRRPRENPDLTKAVDTVVGVGNGVAAVAGTVAETAGRLAGPAMEFALHPPLVPRRWHLGTVLEQFEAAGRASREQGEQDVVSLAGELIPAILHAVLDRIDLTQLVLDRVDLGRIVDAVDLDAVVARVDIDAIIDRVDIDAILARVDIDGVVATVDLNRVIGRVDVDAIVARVDVDAVVARVDVDAIIDRMDLGEIAGEVIDEIDLPRIIRESTGSIASETMVGVRLTTASADDHVGRLMEKLHLRRRGGPGDDPTLLAVPVQPLPARRRRAVAAPALPPAPSEVPEPAPPPGSPSPVSPSPEPAPPPGSPSPVSPGTAIPEAEGTHR
jgi:hypothetical protein